MSHFIIIIDKANVTQSALCLWTSPDPWPVEVADLRKGICTNPLETFQSPLVLEEATEILKIFRSLNIGDEDDRPTKRRKTLPHSSEDINDSTYKHLMIVLNGSSQESPVLNLSNLHNIVQ